jgi:hypothetical protein
VAANSRATLALTLTARPNCMLTERSPAVVERVAEAEPR